MHIVIHESAQMWWESWDCFGHFEISQKLIIFDNININPKNRHHVEQSSSKLSSLLYNCFIWVVVLDSALSWDNADWLSWTNKDGDQAIQDGKTDKNKT